MQEVRLRLVLRRWLDRKIIWFYPEGWGFQTFKAVNHFVRRKSYAGTQYIKQIKMEHCLKIAVGDELL